MSIDIFRDEYKVASAIFNFDKVGDQVQGTYVRKSEAKSKFSGLMEPLYEIRTTEGEYFTIWGKPIINQQMARVKLGQIVGFKLIEERKSEKGNPSKIIQVFADPKLVDEEFLQELKELEGSEASEEGVVVEDVNLTSPTPTAAPAAPDIREREIFELAKTKLGVTAEAEVKQKVMEKTGLAWIGTNLDGILEKMKTL